MFTGNDATSTPINEQLLLAKERFFWLTIRKGLLMIAAAIAKKYGTADTINSG